jgi:hypothetical protein
MKKCTILGHRWQKYYEPHRHGGIDYRVCLRCHRVERYMWQNSKGQMVNGVSPGKMRWVEVPEWYFNMTK